MFKTELDQKYMYNDNPSQEFCTRGIKVYDDEKNEYQLFWEASKDSETFYLVNNKSDNIIFQCNYEGLNCLKKMVDSIDIAKVEIEKFRLEANK